MKQTIVTQTTKQLQEDLNGIFREADRELIIDLEERAKIAPKKVQQVKDTVKQQVAQKLTAHLEKLGFPLTVRFTDGELSFDSKPEKLKKDFRLLKSSVDKSSEQKEASVDPKALKEMEKKLSETLKGIDKGVDQDIDKMVTALEGDGKNKMTDRDRGAMTRGAIGMTLTALAMSAVIIGGIIIASTVAGPAALLAGIVLASSGGLSTAVAGALLTNLAVAPAFAQKDEEIKAINNDTISKAVSNIAEKLKTSAQEITKIESKEKNI